MIAPKPIKFNARVIVTLGVKDTDADKSDHFFSKKLRVLCGRKKKAIMLLVSGALTLTPTAVYLISILSLLLLL
jgi:hypothetical protein